MVRRRLCLLAALLGAPPLSAQQNFDSIQVTTQAVNGSVWMLKGAGGNIGVSAGPDGVFLIDDQFAPLTERIRAAVASINPGPIRFVLNTHWHGDHTGGNENLARDGVIIVAHENVRHRLSVDQFRATFGDTVRASPAAALPVVTFTDTVSFYLNQDTVTVFHVAAAHTDGDAIIHFRRANVVHMGDTYFNGRYPLIDLAAGGSIDGMIAAVDRVLAFADADTRLIPGHGALSNKAELAQYRTVLATIRDRVKKLVSQGKNLEQVKAAKPTAEWDATWGQGFMKPDVFLGIVYRSVGGK